MRTLFTRVSLLMLTMLGFASISIAQTPTYSYTLGTGSNAFPLNSTVNRTQFLYKPSDFVGMPGNNNITKVYIQVGSNVAAGSWSDFTIRMGNTTLTAFSSGPFVTPLTQVYYSATQTHAAVSVSSWYEVTLQTPFLYTGTSNFIVDISQTAYTNGFTTRTSGVANSRLYGAQSNLSATAGAGNISIGFDVVPAAPCTAPPVAGTSTASPSLGACVGAPLTLNLTGNSQGTGQTYQWQSSPTAAFTTPTNVGTPQISGFFTTTVTGALYYRAAVTCGTSTTYSTPVQVTVGSAFSGTYTIDAGSPVSTTNFQSFTAAVAALTASCGPSGNVVFNVVANSGPYTEQVIIPNLASSSAANTVTFNGNGNQLYFSSTNSNDRGLIKLDGADYIRFNNLNLYANGSYGYAIQLLNDADNNTFTNMLAAVDSTIASTNYTAVSVSGSATAATTANSQCDSNTFTNVSAVGGYYCWTMLGNSTSSQIYNNKIINCNIRNFYYYGLYSGGTDGLEVSGTTISRPNSTTIASYYGAYFQAGTYNLLFDRNKLTQPFGGNTSYTGTAYGIYNTADATVGRENIFQNNLFYDWQSNGTQWAIYTTGANYGKYYHNTIVLDDNNSSNCACDTRGFYQSSNGIGMEFKNNIFYITREGQSGSYGFYPNAANSSFAASNNLYYITNPNGANIGYYNGIGYTTLSSWQSATGRDANSVFANPIFANLATNNFRPTNNIDNLGTPVGTLRDHFSALRSTTTPDIGAIEFITPNCTTPPLAGTATGSPTNTCIGSQVQLLLTGNSIGTGQTYQWQSGTSASGPWTNIGTPQTLSPYTATALSPNNYYRAIVTCSGLTSTSNVVTITAKGTIAGNFTINKNAPSSATNFVSFTDFADALSCGVSSPVVATVVPGSGPYNEQVKFLAIPGSSATNSVTILGSGNTITFASNNANERATVKLENTHNLSINDLIIKATGTTYGTGVHLYYDADSNTINGCTIDVGFNITSGNFTALAFSGSPSATTTLGATSNCDDNTVSNNTIIGGYYGITFAGNSIATRSKRNKFIGNSVQDWYLYGMYNYYQDDMIIENNDFSRPNRTSFTTTYAMFNQYALDVKIAKNRIHDLFTNGTSNVSQVYGIYIANSDATAPSDDNLISNNLIYNMNGGGIVYGMYNSGSNWCTYYHNIINIDFPASTSASAVYNMYFVSSMTNIKLFNNILTNSRGGASTKYLVYFSTVPTSFTANKNVYYYSTGTTGTNNIGYYSASAQLNLSNWQSATGQDAGAVNRDPIYANAAAGNLTPTNALIGNLGNPVGILTDILNNTRSTTTPDAGAYEWPYTICPPPTNLTINNITATNATGTWTPVTGAVGYEYKVDLFSTNPTGAGTPTATASGTVTGLQANTQYYYHVRTNCGSSFSTWVTKSFITACPVAPTGVTVSAITTTSALINWNPVPGTLGYEYALQTSAIAPANGTPTASTSISSSTLSPNTTYYFFVRSKCTNTNFSVWTVVSFTTLCPATSGLLASSITPTTATVSWNPVVGVLGYEYRVSTVSTPPASGTFTTTTSQNLTGLTPITQYYLHVRVKCSNTSFSPWNSIPFSTPCLNQVANITPAGPTTICQGNSVVLNANTGTGLTYQWQLNNNNIIGATASSYTASLTGNYTVVINTSPLCAIISSPIIITVVPNPPAFIQPTQSFICNGSFLTLVANSGGAFTYQWQLNSTNIPGAISNTYNATAAGNYRVVVTENNFCFNTSSLLPLTISSPQVVNTTDSINCGVGSVVLKATGTTNTTLRWFESAVGGFPIGVGSPFTTPIITATKTYYVSAFDGFGQAGPVSPASLDSQNTNSTPTAYTRFSVANPLRLLSVDVYPNVPLGTLASIEIRDSVGSIIATVPYQTNVTPGNKQTVPVNVFLQIGNDYRIKQGATISLRTGRSTPSPYPYGSTNIDILGVDPGTATNQFLGFFNWQYATGCESGRVAVIANIDQGPGAVVAPNPASFCTGSSVTLYANAGSPSFTYQWNKDGIEIPGANGSTYSATAIGSYTVRVKDTGVSCSSESNPLQVSRKQSPVPVIQQNGNVLTTTAFYTTYQWFRNGVAIPTAIGKIHPASSDGKYSVQVSDTAGCTATSAEVDVKTTGIKTVNSIPVSIHPNPATTVINVEVSVAVDVTITSMEGKTILTTSSPKAIDISRLASGMYFIKVADKNNNLLKIEKFNKVD